MLLDDVMKILEKSGTEQYRKTYRRHGAPDPMFGTSWSVAAHAAAKKKPAAAAKKKPAAAAKKKPAAVAAKTKKR